MTEEIRGRGKSRRSRLLAVSLVLNLFLVGLVLGFGIFSLLDDEEENRRRSWGLRMELKTYAEAMPEEHREAFRDEIRAVLPEARERWRRLRALRAEVADLVIQPEVDRPAIDARLEEIRRLSTEVQALFQARAFDAILALPEDLRQSLDITFERDRDREDEERRDSR